MTLRNLDTRVGALEAATLIDRGEFIFIDPATMTDEQLEVCEHLPRLLNGELNYAAMSVRELRVLAGLCVE